MIGERHIALRIHQRDMAGRGYDVLLLVVVDAVGEQDAPLIVDLDMTDGRDDVPVGVGLRFVGTKQHLAVQIVCDVTGRRLCTRGDRERRGKQGGCDDRYDGLFHPSSWWKTSAIPIRMAAPAGAAAANAVGTIPDWPSARVISLKKKTP